MQKCTIFIDESGTINFDNEKFIIAGIVIDDTKFENFYENIEYEFALLHHDMHISLKKEIKGTNLKRKHDVWENFMKKIALKNLDLRAIIIDENHFEKYATVIDTGYAKNSYYDFLVGKLIRSVIRSYPDLIDVEIIIDNHGSSDIALREYLYNEFVIRELIDNDQPTFINITVQSVNSSDNYPIQLVDIIVHTLFAHFNHDNHIGYNKIKDSFHELIFVPKKKLAKKL